MLIKSIKKIIENTEGVSLDWEDLRQALLRRSLLLLLPVTALYVLVTGLLGQAILPSLAGLGFAGLVLLLQKRHPEARRLLVWSLGLATVALVLMSQLLWPGPAPAPALVVAMVLSALGLMLDGPGLGLMLFIGGLGLAGVESLRAGDAAQATAVFAQAGMGIGLFVCALAWHRALSRGLASLVRSGEELRAQQAERQALSQALFEDLTRDFAGLQAVMGSSGNVPWAQVQERVTQIRGSSAALRNLRETHGDPPEPAPLDFGRAVLVAVLGMALSLSTLAMAVYLRHGHGHPGTALLTVAASVVGLVFLFRNPALPRGLAWAAGVFGPLVLILAAWKHGPGLPDNAVYWCLSIFNGGLLLGWRPALSIAGLAAAAVLAGLLADPQAGSWDWQAGAALLFAFALVMAICLQAIAWQRDLIERLQGRRARLREILVQRRRLLGTLFHDVANPLAALQLLAHQGRAGLAAPGDAERARRLVRRLGELLQSSRAWLLGGTEPSQLEDVELEPLLAAMADLFHEQLAQKRLALSVEAEPGLAARAQVAVLRDSVLGNLMSNAIKFAPPGSALELQACRHQGQACIELRDRGPGLPPGLRPALAQGRGVEPGTGSGGERGQGLGLILAGEHLRRMGGQLQLTDREGGGTLARACLAPAESEPAALA